MLPTIAGLNNAETSLYAETQKGPTVSITEPPNRGHATVNLRLKELTLHTSFCFLLFFPPHFLLEEIFQVLEVILEIM